MKNIIPNLLCHFLHLPASLRTPKFLTVFAVLAEMRLPSAITSASLSSVITSALAVNLYVSSYDGVVTSLSLSTTGGSGSGYELKTLSITTGSAPSPSWLEVNKESNVVYCLDEGLGVVNGSIAVYNISAGAGDLILVERHTTINGPVNSVIYNNGKALAAAHYEGSSLTTWNVLKNGSLTSNQAFTFTMKAPGPNAVRQDAPHPHEVLVDPTGSYIVAPDLGADFLRIFSINPHTSNLTALPPFSVPPGSGPRHGAFYVAKNKETYFYLVSELACTVATYKVIYGKGGLTFQAEAFAGIYGNETTPVGAAAAEAVLSPDKRFLLTSDRNATTLSIPNFNTTNTTLLPSDTLQSWSISPTTGNLTFAGLFPAGGSYPRQFSVNQEGTLVAVGLQMGGSVVVMQRDIESGILGNFVAFIEGLGQVTSVVWGV